MASAAPGLGSFTVGGVVNRMVAAIRDHWQTLGIVAVATGVVSALVAALSMSQLLTIMDPNNPAAALGMFTSSAYWGTVLGSMLVNCYALAAMLAVLVGKGGSAMSAGEAFAAGLRLFLPMLGLAVLWWVGIYIGLILLFVPGLILLTMWIVCAPVLVAEGLNPIATFGRSRALTKGNRWPVFGALIVFLIVYSLILGVLQGGSTMGMITLYRNSMIGGTVMSVVMSSLIGILNAAFLAALYGELREAKEGGSESRLADVFA